MRAQILNFTYFNRQGILTLKLDGDFRNQYDKLKDSDVEVSIDRYREKRSLDANALAWVMIHKIAAKMHEEPIITYRKLIKDFSVKTHVVCVQAENAEKEISDFCAGHMGRMVDVGESKIPGCVILHKKYGSSSFDSAQMSAFIDIIMEQCRELGIETRSEEEIQSILKEWK